VRASRPLGQANERRLARLRSANLLNPTADEPRPTTPVPFSSEEAASIREAFAMPGAVRCPRCSEVLQMRRWPEGEFLTLICEPCRRILALRDRR
jgi:hypothetical protein